MNDLRGALDLLFTSGVASDPIDHARQVAMAASIISQAFDTVGLRSTLVGGSAIEVYAPGIFKSGDIDLVIESPRGETVRDRLDGVFSSLGFTRVGRHWKRGDLFVEVPSSSLDENPERVRVGHFVLNIVSKESLLADRVVGFKWWGVTAHGQQAIDMIAAFGNDVELEKLYARLDREDSRDAYDRLASLAASGEPVTEAVLARLLVDLGRVRP